MRAVLAVLLAVLIVGPEANAQDRGFFKEWFSDDGKELRKPAKPKDVREKKTKVTYAQCVSRLETKPGWCQLSGGAIRDVFPINQPIAVRLRGGPSTVVSSWSGAAFDKEGMKVYFHGGGHTDYGGNEVYEFDLRKSFWRRLTNPSGVRSLSKDGKPLKTPSCEIDKSHPPSAQTFDGIIFSQATCTLWVFPSGYAWCGKYRRGTGDVWEFNPSAKEERNGLAPLTWQYRTKLPLGNGANNFRTAELPNGWFFVGSTLRDGVFNPKTLQFKAAGRRGGRGAGNSIYDPGRDLIWTLHKDGIYITKGPRISKLESKSGAGVIGLPGVEMLSDGRLIVWSGGPWTNVYDPKSRSWRLYEFEGKAPTWFGNNVLSRWIKLPGRDLFLAITDSIEGLWLYRHPENAPGTPVFNNTVQKYVDVVAPGAIVNVPPGIYPSGSIINKSVSLNLKGVRIMGKTGGKAVLLVKNARGPVVIQNFSTDFPVRCSNCAGIKIEGVKFNVTVRNGHIRNAEMGILTDNRGGQLIVEDTLIEDIGHARGREPHHLIYAGVIDELLVRRSTLRRSHYLGHILKSRARKTTVLKTSLLSQKSRNSRELDLPCGGQILLQNLVIQKGPNADNNDSIAVGTEKNCGGAVQHPNTRFTMRDSWMIFDREKSSFGTLKMKAAVDIRNNRFVNMRGWGSFPDSHEGNKLLADKRSLGHGPDWLPKP